VGSYRRQGDAGNTAQAAGQNEGPVAHRLSSSATSGAK
jgi:hypothetical protein